MAADPARTGISSLRRAYQDPLGMLLAIAGTVLLIACANLANLMFARANAREREIAVRLALGASRGRVIQQLLAESLLLSFSGALAGIALAQALTRILISFFSTQFRSISLDLTLDWRVLGFTAAVAVLTCLIFGLMPAVKSTNIPPMAAMKAGSRGVTAGRERFGLRRVLVVTQVALSMVLLVGAFLFVRSFQNLINVDAGFRQTEILAADLDFTQLKIPTDQRNQYKQQLADRLQAIPGVQSAATADIVPISGNGWNEDVHFDNRGSDVHEIVNFSRVSPGYFRTLDIPLIEGRDFGQQDTLNAPAVAVVNQLFVHKVLQDKPPLGRVFNVDEGAGRPPSPYQIVGVVKNTKYFDLREDLFPIAYLARSQDKKPDTDASILIRSSLPPAALSNEVERATAQMSPSILIQFSVFKTQIRDSLQRERLMASLSGFFGLLAGLLATIGLYGVISYMVVRRRSEIGIRMALGADRARVLALVMREAAILLGIGVAIGAALSLLSARTASALLYGLKPYDPPTLVLAGLALTIVAAGASYLPAFRAARIQPTEALREE
jgi:predicted permease